MRIIVVEDDDGVAEALVDTLTDAGWDCRRCARGDDGLRAVRDADLVLLDLGLPDMDGLDFLRTLRRASEVPVLVLTARDGDGAHVLGLRAGADDYLVKPVRAPVLVARVQALARRARVAAPTPGAAPGVLTWGGLRLDVAARTAVRDGTPVDLTATELEVLLCVAERPGEAVSRETVHLRVWGGPDPGRSRSLDFIVASLRHKLGPDLPLTTVRGFGYRLET
ncbi:response regulator transcription factor [Phycicoccus sp. BSK3Z-2]|uniref:Response regulator transcription factor n=1 Tax=Phycicoccus avicenniae TaxID=2828860 RepID=A0A941D9T0_9MICO|nr:response regulator transcription factor [Phycicoccus avicenniae]MBR7744729.1 response regulator transcription factor [Phycicoccus avicenniae]